MADDAARSEILARIAGAVDDVRSEDPDGARARMPRDYRSRDASQAAARLDRFEERLVDYGVDVARSAERSLPEAVAAELRRRRVARLVVPHDLPERWLTACGHLERVPSDAPPAELDRADGVVTGCAVAISETGTIVLDGGSGQGRRAATLVPDLHLCVVAASQLVGLVPEAVERLAPAVRAGRPLTWVSGPSATSDIELIRVAGVHGPRRLIVILVRDA